VDATPIVIRHPDAAAVHVDAWTALAAHAIEPNFFQEPWALLPAWHAFGGDVDLRLVLFYDADGLAGVFPLERVSRWHGLPVPRFRTWRPPHCFLGTPLVRRGAVAACLDALRDWAAKDADGAPLIEIDHYPTAGPFHEEVTAYATSRDCPIFVGDSSERAFLTRAPDPTALVQQFLSADKRKELRRQRRRLAERGVLETRVLRGDQDVERWLAAFLELEASGWKGREGSAFSMGPSRDYFLEMCRAAHARGRLLFMGLMLDDRPVALKCDILSLPGSCAFRIAYDEAFAKYSPGVLLELDHVHELHARPDWQWMDSGAEPDHPMINHLWRERREIATSTIGAGPLTGDVAVALARAARKGMKLVKRVKQSNQLR
jgi:CelD/BcsL family acetyltransferase involved in cellulose biosynthesis